MAQQSVKDTILINGVIPENSCIRFVESAKNLGVEIDSLLQSLRVQRAPRVGRALHEIAACIYRSKCVFLMEIGCIVYLPLL